MSGKSSHEHQIYRLGRTCFFSKSESVKSIITKVPELGALMVDINALASAQKELQDQRSGLAVLYAQAAAKAEKGLSNGSL